MSSHTSNVSSLSTRAGTVAASASHGGISELHWPQNVRGLRRAISSTGASSGQTIRRIVYQYNGQDRVVGRRAEKAVALTLATPLTTLTWVPEDRRDLIAADGFPQDTTFVWDPVSDTLVSVFNAADGTLLRQTIHGGLQYDDPIEVATLDTTAVLAPGGTPPVVRLYPIYDEAGNGTLRSWQT